MTHHAKVTAVVITKNEGLAIERCIRSLSFCDQVVVIDSRSTDETAQIARGLGADIIAFEWNGEYPKKKQWGMEHPIVRNDWVLHMDADEIVSPGLAAEIGQALAMKRPGTAAFDVPLEYHFAGKKLRHGHQVMKRSLVDKTRAKFPEVGDLQAPGITEVEGHYQPTIDGATERLGSRLIHDDPDPLSDWIARHNRYSDWESYLNDHRAVKELVRGSRSRGGRAFDRAPWKPLIFFIYAFVVKRGFLDGRAGYDYAFALSFYYWMIGAKTRELRRRTT